MRTVTTTTTAKKHVLIIGAGPAGLTAAYLLAKQNVAVTVVEADERYVGGISRTVHYKDYSFDIGGHRFFSKSQEVEDFWTEILPNDMLERPRSSRIFYNGKFFAYPLKPFEALFKLGLWESIRCVASFAKRQFFPTTDPKNFQEWVSNQFGSRLFQIFFQTYTEKVWGMKCTEISADWAAQRIKGLSLWSAVIHAFLPPTRNKDQVIKTLIDSFRYPRKGPGMMWEVCADKVRAMGGTILMGHRVERCQWSENGAQWRLHCKSTSGKTVELVGSEVISSAPLRELMRSLSPQPDASALKAADSLRYRDFLTVALMLKDRDAFSDNWIYIHDPDVKVGRIQNFKSWSPEMVPDASMNCYGLEYFCFEHDGLWSSPDADLIALAKREVAKIGLAKEEDIVDGCVIRQPKAYPVYDEFYAQHVEVIRQEMTRRYPTLSVVGRNGMHKYNNQDHSMMTAMLCVKNILAGERKYDLWQVNQDAEYHESGRAGEQVAASGLRMVPVKVDAAFEPQRAAGE